MQADVRRVTELTAAEIETWRAFQAASPSLASPFFSPEFALAVAAARRDAQVAVLTRKGRTVGFLPFHRTRLGVAKPIGGSICDYQGVVHAPGVALDAGAMLRACRLSAYDFNHAPVAQSWLRGGAFAEAASPVMDLSGGYAAYLRRSAEGGARSVKEVARKRRKLEREIGALRFVVDDRAPGVWDALTALKRDASAAKGSRSALDTPWIGRVVDRLRATDTPRFGGVTSTLYAGDRLIAAHFGMRSERVWAWWFPTYDPELARFSPGLVLLLEIAAEAAKRGATEIDLGRGDQRYKTSFATRANILCEGSVERPVSVAGALRLGQRAAMRLGARLPDGRLRSLKTRLVRRLVGGGVHLPNEA